MLKIWLCNNIEGEKDMELICCKEDVVKKLNEFVEVIFFVILFKKGNMYLIKMDINYNWIVMDE